MIDIIIVIIIGVALTVLLGFCWHWMKQPWGEWPDPNEKTNPPRKKK